MVNFQFLIKELLVGQISSCDRKNLCNIIPDFLKLVDSQAIPRFMFVCKFKITVDEDFAIFVLQILDQADYFYYHKG